MEMVISVEYTRQQNAHVYKEIVAVNDERFSVVIKRDANLSQSYARISIWSGARWNVICAIDGPHMKMQVCPCSNEIVGVDNFRADRDALLRIAILVCG